ncbi:TPR-like protein [Polychaeton citri CBS 116435]|uniref:TPR-like protein n=1 Tax=Polychaeton citri CBS 116435 TaxID=1314669 RepID=A0A9P4QBR5_9PEZI|nr:TPR-like protein [Polychaeton citri CBS 116435]
MADLDALINQRIAELDLEKESSTTAAAAKSQDGVAAPPEPPAKAAKKEVTADELWKEMNRHPLFMTSLDETDGGEGSNELLESLKALAYEGTKAEVAQNFKDQGNEAVATKQWVDAREFYTKAIQTLRGLIETHEVEDEEPEVGKIIGEIDEEAEAKRERLLEEQCLVNRALCQLEMKNYGSCNRDCAAALKMNPRNVKAWYRAASACLALDKTEEALDAGQSGLRFDSNNAALKNIVAKVEKRAHYIASVVKTRQEREERERRQQATLHHALKSRNILTRTTPSPPNMEDAAIALENPVDASSTLSLPVIFLYPLEAQSDFVKSCKESDSLGQHLAYILPVDWDQAGEYAGPEAVECYMETAAGGLIKAGMKMSLLRLLGSGKVELVDGLVRISVVPKTRTAAFIEEFKKRKGKS